MKKFVCFFVLICISTSICVPAFSLDFGSVGTSNDEWGSVGKFTNSNNVTNLASTSYTASYTASDRNLPNSDSYQPYSQDEFPKWALDLRRAECIFFGGIPIAYPITALAFNLAGQDQNFLRNLAIACSVSAVITLLDYIIGVIRK